MTLSACQCAPGAGTSRAASRSAQGRSGRQGHSLKALFRFGHAAVCHTFDLVSRDVEDVVAVMSERDELRVNPVVVGVNVLLPTVFVGNAEGSHTVSFPWWVTRPEGRRRTARQSV